MTLTQRESRLVQMSALPGLVDLLEPWLFTHRDEAGLGRYWSPLDKETSQCLQLGRGGRERPSGEEGGDTHFWALSLQTSFLREQLGPK